VRHQGNETGMLDRQWDIKEMGQECWTGSETSKTWDRNAGQAVRHQGNETGMLDRQWGIKEMRQECWTGSETSRKWDRNVGQAVRHQGNETGILDRQWGIKEMRTECWLNGYCWSCRKEYELKHQINIETYSKLRMKNRNPIVNIWPWTTVHFKEKIFSNLVNKFLVFTAPDGSLPYSQNPILNQII
jgi:hypothetical protein